MNAVCQCTSRPLHFCKHTVSNMLTSFMQAYCVTHAYSFLQTNCVNYAYYTSFLRSHCIKHAYSFPANTLCQTCVLDSCKHYVKHAYFTSFLWSHCIKHAYSFPANTLCQTCVLDSCKHYVKHAYYTSFPWSHCIKHAYRQWSHARCLLGSAFPPFPCRCCCHGFVSGRQGHKAQHSSCTAHLCVSVCICVCLCVCMRGGLPWLCERRARPQGAAL